MNHGIITLLPKIKDASKIRQFGPTCLINYVYKWFTKVLTMRLDPVAGRLIHKAQTSFIHGTNIMNGVLAVYEILYVLEYCIE
jgi:hypothetical protein